jgi:hypothetical protein
MPPQGNYFAATPPAGQFPAQTPGPAQAPGPAQGQAPGQYQGQGQPGGPRPPGANHIATPQPYGQPPGGPQPPFGQAPGQPPGGPQPPGQFQPAPVRPPILPTPPPHRPGGAVPYDGPNPHENLYQTQSKTKSARLAALVVAAAVALLGGATYGIVRLVTRPAGDQAAATQTTAKTTASQDAGTTVAGPSESAGASQATDTAQPSQATSDTAQPSPSPSPTDLPSPTPAFDGPYTASFPEGFEVRRECWDDACTTYAFAWWWNGPIAYRFEARPVDTNGAALGDWQEYENVSPFQGQNAFYPKTLANYTAPVCFEIKEFDAANNLISDLMSISGQPMYGWFTLCLDFSLGLLGLEPQAGDGQFVLNSDQAALPAGLAIYSLLDVCDASDACDFAWSTNYSDMLPAPVYQPTLDQLQAGLPAEQGTGPIDGGVSSIWIYLVQGNHIDPVAEWRVNLLTLQTIQQYLAFPEPDGA